MTTTTPDTAGLGSEISIPPVPKATPSRVNHSHIHHARQIRTLLLNDVDEDVRPFSGGTVD
jgi:hypothetical protein